MLHYYCFSFLVYAVAFCNTQDEGILIGKRSLGVFCGFSSRFKTSGLWDILENLFEEITEVKEEEGVPSKKIQLEDEPSTSSDPMDPHLSTTPSPKIEITFPVNEVSLHNSGISQEYLPIGEQLPHRKAVYLCGFQC